LKRNNPRDIDILCVIPNTDFKKIFGLSAEQWRLEGKTGEWGEDRYKWARETIKVGKILAHRLSSINVDFKFVPESFYAMIKEGKD